MNKRILWNAFQYLLAVGLLTLVIVMNWGTPGSDGLGDVWRRHVNPPEGVEREPVHWNYLLIGFAIYSAAVFLTLVRWYLLVRAQGLQVSLPEALRLGLIGFYFSAFLPGSVGGDIVKAAALARGQERRTVAVATVLMDRILALWGLVWLVAFLGSVFWLRGALDGETAGPAKSIVTSALVIVGLSLAVWVMMGLLSTARAEALATRLHGLPKVGGSAAELWRAVWLYRCKQWSVWLTMGLSWIGFVGFILTFYCCAHALYDGNPAKKVPDLTQHFLIVPIGLVIQAAPLFPGGAGIGEAGFGGLYKLFSCAAQNGALGSLVMRMMTWTFGLLGFAVYRLQRRRPVETAPMPLRLPTNTETLWARPHAESLTTPRDDRLAAG